MRASAGLLLVGVLGGCSPVYWFHIPEAAPNTLSIEPISRRIDPLLQRNGFVALGRTDVATGDIECGRDAKDRSTFEKEWRDSTWLPSYRWIWVHRFSCDDAWYLVIVSSTNAEQQAADLRNALSVEFSHEISSGIMHVRTRHRVPLE